MNDTTPDPISRDVFSLDDLTRRLRSRADPDSTRAAEVIDGYRAALAATADATCPHLVTGDEGTSYCALAERAGRAATADDPAALRPASAADVLDEVEADPPVCSVCDGTGTDGHTDPNGEPNPGYCPACRGSRRGPDPSGVAEDPTPDEVERVARAIATTMEDGSLFDSQPTVRSRCVAAARAALAATGERPDTEPGQIWTTDEFDPWLDAPEDIGPDEIEVLFHALRAHEEAMAPLDDETDDEVEFRAQHRRLAGVLKRRAVQVVSSLAAARSGGATCMDCGARYATVWWADHGLWESLTEWRTGNGLLCPRCFAGRAAKGGVPIQWRAWPLDHADATCPHVVTSDEGSSFCALAEGAGRAATADDPAPERSTLAAVGRDLYAAEVHRQMVGWDDYCTELLVRSQHAIAALLAGRAATGDTDPPSLVLGASGALYEAGRQVGQVEIRDATTFTLLRDALARRASGDRPAPEPFIDERLMEAEQRLAGDRPAEPERQTVADRSDETCMTCTDDPSKPRGECPGSRWPCGHHSNALWDQDQCSWCDAHVDDAGNEVPPAARAAVVQPKPEDGDLGRPRPGARPVPDGCPCVTAPSREAAMVVLERDAGGRPAVFTDPCIAPTVRWLRSLGIDTVASCCGHGQWRPWVLVSQPDAGGDLEIVLFTPDELKETSDG